VTRRFVSWHAGALALALSCGHPVAAPPLVPAAPAAAANDACLLAPDSIALPDSLGIAVPDVRGFVERQVYETLIRIDCRGAVDPQLARSWTGGDGGRRWTFTLRPDARFSDGVSLTAADVFAVLTGDSSLLAGGIASLESVDRVSVRFPVAFAGVPPVFADPALRVSRLDVTIGSGAVRVDSSSGVVTLTPLGPGRPAVTVRSSAGGDARDLLDHGIDLLVSGDPEVLSYAAAKSELTAVPLPWDRVYVLVSALPVTIGDAVRTGLARDVVRSDARPARGNHWWMAGPGCPTADTAAASPGATGASPATVVYYPQGDAAARGLAERLVALGLLGPGGRAGAVAAADFDGRVAAGGASYLVPLPREALAPCHAVAELAARAPWLSSDPSRYITALVETRRRAIVRRGGSGFTVDWDGTLRLR
jgi:hypothetical protein